MPRSIPIRTWRLGVVPSGNGCTTAGVLRKKTHRIPIRFRSALPCRNLELTLSPPPATELVERWPQAGPGFVIQVLLRLADVQ